MIQKRQTYLLCCVCFTALLIPVIRVNGLLDKTLFEQELKRIGDEALGISVVQGAYDQPSYNQEPLNGKSIVDKIANGISAKIEGLVKPLSDLRQAIENDVLDNTPVFEKCCEASSLTPNTIYRTKVNLDKGCYAESSSTTSNRRYPSKSIEDLMIQNRNNNPDLIWQYYGSKEGIFVNYPSVKLSDCDYDPRFRPYFASGARPKPKDVVIVTDTSGSMNNLDFNVPYLQIAKDAAITVLKTLSPNDKIGLVSFNSEAKTPDGCYNNNLATATAHNIKKMESYINLLGANGETNYEAALSSAFKFFHQLEKPLSENRDQIILFLTDGKYTRGRNPLEVIKGENEKLNNSVVIFTFALGRDIGDETTQLLEDMANQKLNNESFGEIQRGKAWKIENPKDLKIFMSSYYQYIPRQHDAVLQTVFSTPYKDILSEIGLISSICQAVYRSGQFDGVVCTDLKISDLISDITFFDDGELSYAFMIDEHERAMVHPILPQTLGGSSDPVLLNIRHFETGPRIEDVIKSMIRGESGNTTYISKRIFRRGSTVNEGIESRDILSHFFWTPVKGTRFSVCVVVGEGDKGAELMDMIGSDDVFMYHRGDIANPPWDSCRHYSRFATIERSSVMLTPSAFEKPFEYIDKPETQAMILDYGRYFTGKTNKNFGLKSTVRSTVGVTHKVESFWKSHPAEYAIWRYISTKDGVVRVFPGIQLEKEWDHHRRPWYWRALSQKGLFVLSAPYQDLWGAGYLLTLTQTIFEGRIDGRHNKTDSPMAVMAIDIPIHYFYNRILTLYPACDEDYSCFVIDNSGFIVMHRDFVESYTDPELEKSYHIAHKEGPIARDLVAENILTTRICTDFEYTRDQVTYRVTLPESKKNGIDKMNNPIAYELRPITNSNLFLIIKKRQLVQTQCCNTFKYLTCSDSQTPCGCLCHRGIDFNYCENKYIKSDTGPPCSAPFINLVTVKLDEKSRVQNLPTCFKLKCESRQTREKCYSIAGCSWCTQTLKGNILNPGCCRLSEECPFGKSVSEDQCDSRSEPALATTTTQNPIEGSEQNMVMIIGIAAGVAVGVILVLLIVIIICMYQKRQNNRSNDPSYITAVSDVGIDMAMANSHTSSQPNYYHDQKITNYHTEEKPY